MIWRSSPTAPPRTPIRRRAAVVSVCALAAALTLSAACGLGDDDPIRVGVLHSLSGTMAASERAVADATRLALDELNAAGGLLDRPIEIVAADGRSDPATFAAEAERLITTERVSVVFGCWTSASRRSVRPVFEAHDHLLFYPLQYEGVEQSPNIVYLGAAPNQQIQPALEWALRNGHERIFLVGSDYVFPRTANAIIRDQVEAWRGKIVGEEYVLLGAVELDDVADQIAEATPDIIINTINGRDTNVSFFNTLRARGIMSDEVPTLSFSVSEIELAGAPDTLAGDYVMWHYFQSLDTPLNDDFVSRFKTVYGQERSVGDPMAAAYVGVHLWARAVEAAGRIEPAAVRANVLGQSVNGPGGMTHVDARSQHTWKTVRLGQIGTDGQIVERWSSEIPIQPEPYPSSRPRDAWDQFLSDLQRGWNGGWENPGTTRR